MNQRTQAMRKRIAILIYLIIGSVAIFSVWYRLTNRESQRPPTLDATEPSRDDQSLQQVREQAKPTNRETATPIKTSEPTADESLRVATESKNVPIYFLGKVVDESDSPLPGVRVRARIRQWDVASYLSMRGKIDSKEIITGASGQFEIKDSRGDVLTIESL